MEIVRVIIGEKIGILIGGDQHLVDKFRKFEIGIADLFRDNTRLPARVENAASRPRQIILALARQQIAGNQRINGIGNGVELGEETNHVRSEEQTSELQ